MTTALVELTTERAALDTQRAQHTDELERLDRQLGTATLESDPMQLAGARVRRDQLAAAIARIDQQSAHLDQRIEPMETQQTQRNGRLSRARRLLAALRSEQALEHPDFRNTTAPTLARDVRLARQLLEAAGETVKTITIKL